MPVLLLVFKVLQMCALGNEQLDHFREPIAAGPDYRIPFLLRVLYIHNMGTLEIDISFFLQALLSLLYIIFLHGRQHAIIQYLLIFLRHFLFGLWIFFLDVLDGRLLFGGGMWWGIHIFDLLFTLRLCLYYQCKLYNYPNLTLFLFTVCL